MTALVNRQVTLASRPSGYPRVSDFRLVYVPVPEPGAGQVLVRLLYLSLDPHLRSRMGDGASWAPSIALGEVMPGGAVGLVLESRDPALRVGDTVEGMLGWQEVAAVAGHALRRIDPLRAPITTALGVLGIPGLTAYFGLLDVCDPRRGETVVVSGGAGGVGMVVAQIAMLRGCRVVGVAGTDAKVAWLRAELGLAGALNHRTSADLAGDLARLCPGGVDVYFDNVGGAITDAVLGQLNRGARVAVCGQVSQYNLEAPELGPRWLGRLIVAQARVQGFVVAAYAGRFAEGREQLGRWLAQGSIKYREDVAQGLEAAPQAFIGMLQGKNEGKQLVQIAAA